MMAVEAFLVFDAELGFGEEIFMEETMVTVDQWSWMRCRTVC